MSCYSKKARTKKVDPLTKKIPKNPRYDNIKSNIDTGSSITKYMAKIEEIRQNYKFRKDEIFKRMKALQIHRTSQLENMSFDNDTTPRNGSVADDDDVASVTLGTNGDNGSRRGSSPVPSLAVTEGDYGIDDLDTERSTLQSVIRGYGQYDVTHPQPHQIIPAPNNCPYLLLDMRDSDEYQQCCMVTAVSYPKANLSKATNYEIKQMLEYKNKPGKIIIIYDDDERIAHTSATTLVQRGYDNLFMLSGGLKVAYKFFPESLIFGRPPASILPPPPPQKRGCRNNNNSTLNTVRSGYDELDEMRRLCFSTIDIDILSELLDQALLDRSVGCRLSQNSSRNSVRSSASTISIQSSVASLSSNAPIGRPAFRP